MGAVARCERLAGMSYPKVTEKPRPLEPTVAHDPSGDRLPPAPPAKRA
jgi:hypothetical protein